MSINIRRAVKSDIGDLILLMEEHALYEKACFDSTCLAPRLAAAMQGEAPRLTIFVAKKNLTSIGYCSLTREFSSWKGNEYLHMDCLFVSRQMRGLKIGKMLFKKATIHAKNIGIGELQWQTPEWNDGATRFYQSLGATSNRKRRFQYQVI